MSGVDKRLFPIFFVIFLDNFGFSIIFNLLPTLFIDSQFHLLSFITSSTVRNVFLAFTYTLFPVAQLIGAPIIGDYADHYGRKKTLYITILIVTLGHILSAMAVSIGSVFLLMISRLIAGFFAGNLSICLAVIADLSFDEKTRARNFSHVTTLFGISWIIAMVVSGYLSDPKYLGQYGPLVVFLITALMSFLSFLALWRFFSETLEQTSPLQFNFVQGVKNVVKVGLLKHLRVIFLIYLFWIIGWGMAIQWYPAYSMEIFRAKAVSIATWMTVAGITWTFGSSILNGLLLDKMHSVTIALLGAGLIALCLFIANFIPWFELFSLLLAIGAIFSAFMMCNTLNFISMSAPKEAQGKAMGLSQSMMAFGWLFSSLTALIINQFSMEAIYWFATSSLGIAFALFAVVYVVRKVKRIK